MSREEVEKRVKEDKEIYTEKFSEQTRDFCSRVSKCVQYAGVTVICIPFL